MKVRDGQVANRPIYVALAVTVDGTRDILGLWAGDGGEGAKYWLQVLTEIKNRGVADVCMVVCDGLKGLPDAIGTVRPQAVTQTCVVHLMRASFRYAARQDWDKISRALKPIYTAPTAKAAEDRFLEFQEEWGDKYKDSLSDGKFIPLGPYLRQLLGQLIFEFVQFRAPRGDPFQQLGIQHAQIVEGC